MPALTVEEAIGEFRNAELVGFGPGCFANDIGNIDLKLLPIEGGGFAQSSHAQDLRALIRLAEGNRPKESGKMNAILLGKPDSKARVKNDQGPIGAQVNIGWM